MAHIDDSRSGQMIIVGGFIMAIGLVVVAAILNGLIFSQNIASKGAGVDTDSGVEFREITVQGVAKGIYYSNEVDFNVKPFGAKSSFFEYIENHSRGTYSVLGRSQTVVSINVTSTTQSGWRIGQNTSGKFNNSTMVDTWNLAENVENVSKLRINMSELPSSNATFTVISGDWKLEVNSSVNNGTETEVRIYDATSLLDSYNVTGFSYVNIEVMNGTNGKINGTGYDLHPGLITGQSSYNITFENGNNVNGTYDIIIGLNPSKSDIEATCGSAICVDKRGYAVDQIESAKIEIRYVTEKVRYNETLTVDSTGEVP